VHILYKNGNLESIKLGNNILNGEIFQFVVPAGCWFASEPGSNFSFVGCTVSPGFDFADFELAIANELSKLYPQHESIIRKLTR
jgi:predicted cupin superfamily sugar epimerase